MGSQGASAGRGNRQVTARLFQASRTMAKYSATEVNYRRSSPGGKRHCGSCINYLEAESRCTMVEGTIKPNFVCNLWKLKTPPTVRPLCPLIPKNKFSRFNPAYKPANFHKAYASPLRLAAGHVIFVGAVAAARPQRAAAALPPGGQLDFPNNSGNGDDGRRDDCSSRRGSDNCNGGRGYNIHGVY